MNYSTSVIPVTKADKTVDIFDKSYTPLNDIDRMNWEACKHILYEWHSEQLALTRNFADDPEVYDGAPVGVQIVARKHEEEKVWAIARIVDAALKGKGGL